mgnify:CR=1 FL=1
MNRTEPGNSVRPKGEEAQALTELADFLALTKLRAERAKLNHKLLIRNLKLAEPAQVSCASQLIHSQSIFFVRC